MKLWADGEQGDFMGDLGLRIGSQAGDNLRSSLEQSWLGRGALTVAGMAGGLLGGIANVPDMILPGDAIQVGNLSDSILGKPPIVPDHLLSSVYIPAIRNRVMYYEAVGRSDALEAATADVIASSAGGRIQWLPNAEGQMYASEDLSPDTARKWSVQQMPDGTTYTPVETFVADSNKPELGFINDGAPIELRSGKSTPIDGGLDVFDAGNMPIRFYTGQTITYDLPITPRFGKFGQNIGPTGDALALTTNQEQTLVLPTDDIAAENMLTEMFEGSGFRVARINDEMWQLQYVAQPRPDTTKSVEQLSREKDEENALAEEERQAGGGATAQQAKDLMKEAGTNAFGLKPTASSKASALRNTARDIISTLQDKDMLPQSLGVTRPLPEFQSAEEVTRFVQSEVLRAQEERGGIPVGSKTAPVDDGYISLRSEFIKSVEGVRSKVYPDTKGIKTVGVGLNLEMAYNTEILASIGVDVEALKAGKVSLTKEQIERSMENALTVAETAVNSKIKVNLSAHARVALISVAFNGPSLLTKDLVDAVNAGDFNLAADILAAKPFNNSRRRAEAQYLRRGALS